MLQKHKEIFCNLTSTVAVAGEITNIWHPQLHHICPPMGNIAQILLLPNFLDNGSLSHHSLTDTGRWRVSGLGRIDVSTDLLPFHAKLLLRSLIYVTSDMGQEADHNRQYKDKPRKPRKPNKGNQGTDILVTCLTTRIRFVHGYLLPTSSSISAKT